MLYPKREKPLSKELFFNPTSEYRATPFWAWNTEIDNNELTWQIEQLKQLGFGGFHMHVRTGMATEYLSEEFMDSIGACIDKAKTEDMLAWLYDEDRWPSGAAGGIVTKNPEHRVRHLLLTRIPYGQAEETERYVDSTASSNRTENGKLLACFDVVLDENGDLASYDMVKENATTKGFMLYAYEETALPGPWYNNQTYLNTLDPAAVAEFIRVTYESYGDRYGDDFGKTVPAIFTDEPQFSHKTTLAFAHDEKDVTLPWTPDLPETFQAAYGKEMLAQLPELLWNLPHGEVSQYRYLYHDHIAERFASAFADQCGAWCEENNLMLTGHMMDEPSLFSQTKALGDAMRSYRSFQLPGIDMLCDYREYTTAKQAQSAARQFGRAGVLSELYGVTNYDFDFRGNKLQGDWQAALGVTVRVPHLSWVSMNGEAKRDYPPTYNYQSPWYKEYPYVEDHFARVNTAMTRGKALSRVAVIHPVESYWLHWGAEESTKAIREQMDANFGNLTEWLLRGQIDFDFIGESLFPEQCAVGAITGKQLPVGEMNYDVVLVPVMETIRSTTLDRLEAFRKNGGRVVFLGNAPTLADALPNPRGKKLCDTSELIEFERLTILDALEDVREIEIRGSNGVQTNGLMYQLREEKGDKWLFVAQADKPKNPDIPQGDVVRIRIRGEYAVTLYDTLDGTQHSLPARHDKGWTELFHPMYEHDSLLLHLAPSAASSAAAERPSIVDYRKKAKIQAVPAVPFTLHEPNSLLLDKAEFALDAGEYRGAEELLLLDNIIRKELGWAPRGSAVAQPWVEKDTSTPHTLKLRFVFRSEIAYSGAKLALENAKTTTVTFNGTKATQPEGWYVDKCIETVALSDIVKGENILELSIPYGKKVDVEYCYLLGAFGVRAIGDQGIIVPLPKTLAFGDISRQDLAFYGGNITYHLELAVDSDHLDIAIPYYRGQMLRVAVNGQDKGVIAYSPYRLAVDGLKAGKQTMDITYFGTRVNTFGQLHRNDRFNQWWGPDSWRTVGAEWTPEYRLWPQGIMKSPELYW